MKENFLFGNLFIKTSKLLALVTLMAGIVLSAVLVLQWRTRHENMIYKNNPELIHSLTVLLRDYGQTKNKVMQLHRQLMTSNEEEIKLYLDPEVYEDYTEVEHFEDLKKQLQSIEKNSEIFKELVFKNFSGSVNFLLEKMREYALLKKWISENPEGEKSQEEGKEGDFYLISSPAETYEKNVLLLKESIDYLSSLKASVEASESKSNIDTMLNHLAQYQNIMRKVNVALAVQDENFSEEDSGNKKRVFIVMDELELMKKNIREAATTNWTVDQRFKTTLLLVEKESAKCEVSKTDLQSLNYENTFRLITVIVITLFLSVGLLVSSDVLKALFQMASEDSK
ncbi:MAG: hypothetical protein MK132_01025 [Lentisphaerales bacterium]|nr:hypothetical protein [Lentisphaerales bacterium]